MPIAETMNAKMTIHFRKQPDGTTLATAVLIMEGLTNPKFHRIPLSPDTDPWEVYTDVANTAVQRLVNDKAVEGQESTAPTKKAGTVIQLRGALPMH